ncbi:sugar phosphate isomerase/epimerase family protein [Oceanobacillus alkalisoli]|uniref:sugar phosphate isomerase/epimerase family protein n=1 Tax=Oceanobacillus alkalisoli TaxID=2925113 RepID=UPI001EE485CD|nr:sugar phosphate isomerase/epimerase family protein [Oceanobacillus alkalisoli]MCG5105092.1 sugar phosphate isomerase/epimerase [Oceanobacillus alkalisoli]
MFHNLAINSNTYHGFSLEQAIKGASKAGFKQIELAAVDHTPHLLADMTDTELQAKKTLLESYGMTCIGIGAHSNLLTDAGIENLLNSMKLATYFNCTYLITSTGEAHGDTDITHDEKLLIKNLEPVLDKCEELGLTLAIETHGTHFATGNSLKKLAQRLNNRFTINYDTANVIFYGDVLPYDDLTTCIDRVAFIHLKDKLGKNKEWNFPAIGDGHLDFKRIFHVLESGNFNGPISVEIEFTPDDPKTLEEVNHAVERSFYYLKRLLE